MNPGSLTLETVSLHEDVQDLNPISPTSQRLLRFVLQNPACTIPEACNGAGFPRHKLLRHLRPLVDSGSLLELLQGRTTYLVPNVEGIEPFVTQLRALADPALRELYEWVKALGEASPQQLIRHGKQMRGWARATVQWRLAFLVEVGLVEHRRERKWTGMHPKPPQPPVIAALNLGTEICSSTGPIEALRVDFNRHELRH